MTFTATDTTLVLEHGLKNRSPCHPLFGIQTIKTSQKLSDILTHPITKKENVKN